MFKYEDKGWLDEQYITQKKTIEQIADECNVSSSTIQNRLVKFDIPRRKLIGKNNPNWKGGISRYNEDYRSIIETSFKKVLSGDEIVHHIDNDGKNNALDNLFLCNDYKHHTKIHRQLVNLAFDLVKRRIIKFDKQQEKYYSSEIMDL